MLAINSSLTYRWAPSSYIQQSQKTNFIYSLVGSLDLLLSKKLVRIRSCFAMTYSQLQCISLMSDTLLHNETLGFGLAISLGWLIQKRDIFLRGRILPQDLIFLLQSPPEWLSDPWTQCLLISVHFLSTNLHCWVTVWTILAHPSAHQTSEALGFSCCFVLIPFLMPAET